MSFKVLTPVLLLLAVESTSRICRPDERCLRCATWNCKAGRTTILVDTSVPYYTFNIVTM